MGRLAKCAGIVLLPLALAGCFGTDGGRPSVGDAVQPFPDNYRTDVLAIMRSYLNNPVGVRDASMADPVIREVGGRPFYVGCLHYTPRESDGSYRTIRERAVVYIDGRPDRVLDRTTDLCAGAVYAPFPEMEKMTR